MDWKKELQELKFKISEGKGNTIKLTRGNEHISIGTFSAEMHSDDWVTEYDMVTHQSFERMIQTGIMLNIRDLNLIAYIMENYESINNHLQKEKL